MRRRTFLSLCAVAAAFFFATATSAGAEGVKIGVLTDLSSRNADLGGAGSVEAAKLAIAEFGGKVLGEDIELLSADMQSKTDLANAIARKWYESDGVDVIVDIPNSSAAIAINHLAEKFGKINIVSMASSTHLSGAECTPNSLHYNYDNYMLASATTQAIMKKGGKTWYTITVDYAFGHDMQKQMTQLLESAGGSVVGSSVFPANTTDYSSYLLKAKASGADVVALLNSGQDLKSSLKQAREFGVDRDQTLVGMSVEITDIDALGLETAQDLVFTSAFYWAQSEAAKAWSKTFLERTGKMPTSVQAAVYSAVRHYLQAVQDSNSKEPQTVLAKMRATPVNDMYTFDGRIRRDGAFVHDVFLTRVKKPSESSGRWDYLEILDTIPGENAYPPADRCKHPKM